MNSNEMFQKLSLLSTNPFCYKFNAHLLIIAQALNNWDNLDEASSTELTSIVADLEKFSKESNASTLVNDIEPTKKQFGVRYAQLMGSVTSKKVYIDNLKTWAFEHEKSIIQMIWDKLAVSVFVSEGYSDAEYENGVMEVLNSDELSSEDKKELVAKLDLLRRANTLPPEELKEVSGESR